jgi:hypothetical protein
MSAPVPKRLVTIPPRKRTTTSVTRSTGEDVTSVVRVPRCSLK